MRLAIILLLLPLTANADPYLDIGLLVSTNRYNHPGSNPLFQVRGGYEWSLSERQSVLFEVEHHCSIDGSPINDKPDERQNNSIGLFYRVRLK